MADATATARKAIRRLLRAPEPEVLAPLLRDAALDPESRGVLKKAGLLRRDAREKERRKYGLKKARKAPQYSKR